MNSKLMFVRTAVVLTIVSRISSAQVPAAPDLLVKLVDKFSTAKQFAFSGDLEITRKSGVEAERVILGAAKVKIAVASDGKCMLGVEPVKSQPYLLISDGRNSWAYMPTRNRYTERPNSAASVVCETPRDPIEYLPGSKLDLAADFTRRVVPILAALSQRVEFANMEGAVLSVISKKDEQGRQDLVYVTLDVATLVVRKISWLHSSPTVGDDKSIVRAELRFTNFSVNQPVEANQFTFNPPQRAKRVDSLPIAVNGWF